jgi:hypothetical protein
VRPRVCWALGCAALPPGLLCTHAVLCCTALCCHGAHRASSAS